MPRPTLQKPADRGFRLQQFQCQCGIGAKLRRPAEKLSHRNTSVVQGVVGIPGSVVIVDVEMGKVGLPAFQPLHQRCGSISVHMANVQTEPQTGMVHTFYNVQKHARFLFQHILENDFDTGILRQKLLPEFDGLLHMPHGVIESPVVSAMDDHLCCAVPLCKINGLPVTVRRQVPGFLVDGAGEELIERRMEHPVGDALYRFQHLRMDLMELFIHVPGCAVFRNFQAEAIGLRHGRRIRSDGGDIDFRTIHPIPPHFSISPYLTFTRSSFSSMGSDRNHRNMAVARAWMASAGTPVM